VTSDPQIYRLLSSSINQIHITLTHTDEDKFGPIVLASMLGFAIVVNFAVNLYDINSKKM
jgi:hypothetical protein